MTITTKAGLSAGQRRLLEEIQAVNFGRIEDLRVRGREPVFDPAPRVVREVKFGGENGPRPELRLKDFVLKRQHRELFERLAELRDGTVRVLAVASGVPLRMSLEPAAK